jgi:HPt (histidine-containing phosphotransfer) domain-containing protein
MTALQFNLDYLKDIFNGNEKSVAEVVKLFLDELPDSVNQLKYAYEENDMQAFRRAAHKLKSSLRAIGADSLGQSAAHMEINSENGVAAISTYWNEFQKELPELEKQLREYLSSRRKK